MKKIKKQEIDQKSEHDLLFRCSCGYPHFVAFSWLDDEPDFGFSVEVIDDSMSLWTRIKSAIKYILKGGKLYWQEIELNSKDLKKLQIFIREYLDALEKTLKK